MSDSTHDNVPALSLQLQALFEQGWEQEVVAQLPATYEQQARHLGAFVRVRKVLRVADLLRGLLAYVLCASSLRQLGAWAVLIGLANVSHVAWQKRLRNARAFLLWLLIERLAVSPVPTTVACSRIILIDATRLKQAGGRGDDWRLHLGYDLLAGRLLDVKVSDGHTAEGFTLFALQAGDVVIADRGYCRRKQLAYALQIGAHLIVRLAVWQVPLLDEDNQPLDVVAWLKQQGSGQHTCAVSFEFEGHHFAGRLLACSLPEEQAERAREKERKKASKQQRQLKAETLYLCGWFLVFTSLPVEQWSDEQVLALYRARWQVELFIKRLKQLLKLAQLRGQTPETNEAILLALVVAWSLLQPEIQCARQVLTAACEQGLQSPQQPAEAAAGDSSRQASPLVVSSWTVTALMVSTLRVLVQGFWTFEQVRACLPDLQRFVCSRRRQRIHQESTVRRRFLDHPGLRASSLFSCSGA